MTFLLGLWGLAFAALIPGMLVTRLLRLDRVFAGLPLAFGLSLILNYLMVSALTMIGIYTRPVLLVIGVLVTAGLVASLTWSDVSVDTGFKRLLYIGARLERLIDTGIWRRRLSTRGWIAGLILAMAVYYIAKSFVLAWFNFGDVFRIWDSVVSWNHWAMEWASGASPQYTYYYPQLLPATWSIPYVFIGRSDLRLFPASIDQFYILFIAWVLGEHALRRRQIWLLFSVPAALLLLVVWNSEPYMRASLADVPVAFFALLTVAVIVAMRRLRDVGDIVRSIWLVAILAAGAAATKQAGLVIALVAPPLVWFYGVPRRSALSQEARRRIARAVVASGCLALAVTMAWYIRAYLLIRAGLNGSEVQWVTSGIYHGQSVLGRMGHAALHIAHDRKSPWVLLVLILAALSLRAGSWRIPVFGLAAGYLLLWSAFFSYDGRNASLALPLIGLLAGEGLVAWRPVIMRWLAAIRLSRAGWKDAAVEHVVRARPSGRIHWGRIAVMLVVGLLLVVAARKITTGRLEARQRELEIAGIGKPGVNALLTTAMDGASQSSTILGTYKWACVIKRIRRGHPCRMVNAPDQVSVAIADGNALVLAIPTKWIEGLQTSLQHRLIVEIGTADGYAVWRSEN